MNTTTRDDDDGLGCLAYAVLVVVLAIIAACVTLAWWFNPALFASG